MNKAQIANVKRTYKGQRIFLAKKQGYSFDLLDDSWVLSYNFTLYLEWMRKVDLDEYKFIDIRLALAHSAKCLASSTMISFVSKLKAIVNHLDVDDFKGWWLTLDDIDRKAISRILHALCSKYYSQTLQPLCDAVKGVSFKKPNRKNAILDIKKGAYSEIELENLQEALRIETIQCLAQSFSTLKEFSRFRTLITSQFITAVTRRPTQLRQIKWCDVLPVGNKFANHKVPDRDWEPLTQHMFSDVEQLHMRIFKGKSGEFRYNVEPRTQRLEPKFSQLIFRYFHVYQETLTRRLIGKGIALNNDEVKELMMRLPLLPEVTLFTSDYKSKEELFEAVSVTSEAYHPSSCGLIKSMLYLFEKLNVKSDRNPTEGLKLSNNRWRHTQLTRAALLGFSPAQISNITGVTIAAIAPYIDLKFKERVKIDEAYAGNHIIKRFDSISATELQKKAGFRVINEFDEEIGYQLNPINCQSCESKLGAPMACYPCDNFRPLETANHQQYLNKAVRKLKINSKSGHPATLRKLEKIIIYIKATIAECNERTTPKLEAK
ncbi:hypothetical protein KCU28_003401 [Vibrio parahaemolyticus]|nr:hypothetical protein [Vibrio parahaemolyticus]ELA9589970.1 hypothetical protein [Vibrio parahaemolyticus]